MLQSKCGWTLYDLANLRKGSQSGYHAVSVVSRSVSKSCLGVEAMLWGSSGTMRVVQWDDTKPYDLKQDLKESTAQDPYHSLYMYNIHDMNHQPVLVGSSGNPILLAPLSGPARGIFSRVVMCRTKPKSLSPSWHQQEGITQSYWYQLLHEIEMLCCANM